ncbi:hypothetical protein [Rhodoferax sp.]|uniref:hypothetical protein n=1 Tax=Rhodoferax sp. TaxID=50421 RepID=UPI0027777B64|nr:hypothetical protein [Rhodoferax sp.]
MKRLVALVLAASTALPLFAQTNVGVSVRINQPGVYGRVDFGNVPPPPVVFAQPILIAPPRVVVPQAPMYLYVPPGHQKHWAKHCRRYNACAQPVYFVQETWLRERYESHHHDRKWHHRGHGRN